MCSACFDDICFSCFSSTSRFFFFVEQSQNLLAELGRCAEKFLKEASRYGEVSLHDVLRPAFVCLHVFPLDHYGCHQTSNPVCQWFFVSKFGVWTVEKPLVKFYESKNLVTLVSLNDTSHRHFGIFGGYVHLFMNHPPTEGLSQNFFPSQGSDRLINDDSSRPSNAASTTTLVKWHDELACICHQFEPSQMVQIDC